MPFDPWAYGPVFQNLVDVDRRRPLDEGASRGPAPAALSGLTVDGALAHAGVADRRMAECCLAGVWLLYDRLDESHTISQSVPTPEGSFWHGVMHRREGDYSNAKYWFRRAGDHPVFDVLAEREGSWDPFEFVDRCQSAVRRGEDVEACLDAQQVEWEALFDWCYRHAVGE